MIANVILYRRTVASWATRFVAPFGSVPGATSDIQDQGATAYTNAANSGTPCTFGTALARATADDIVSVAAGTYAVPGTNSRLIAAYNTANSGTAGHPIIFRRATSRPLLTLSSGLGVTLGSYNRNYVIWDGFEVTEPAGAVGQGVSDTGPCVIYGCTGSEIMDCVITGCGWPSDQIDGSTLVPNKSITSTATGSPAVFTIVAHGYIDGNWVHLAGYTGSTPTVPDGPYEINFVSADTFNLISVVTGSLINLTSAGSGGIVRRLRVDNVTGVRVEGSTDCAVRNTRISNVYTAHNTLNGSGIETYSVPGLIIEHCHISECGAGIFIKGRNLGDDPSVNAMVNGRIRYNLIENCGETRSGGPTGSNISLHLGAECPSGTPLLIHQNIIRDGILHGINLRQFADPNHPKNVKILNNVLYQNYWQFGVDVGSLTDDAGHLLQNNIFISAAARDIRTEVSTPANIADTSRFIAEHNIYFDSNSTFATLADEGSETNYTTLADWKAGVSHDSASPAASSTDPDLVNPAGGDFHINGGSYALTQGRAIHGIGGADDTTIPAGCYITGSETIGLES
jgi:hypothetical protein